MPFSVKKSRTPTMLGEPSNRARVRASCRKDSNPSAKRLAPSPEKGVTMLLPGAREAQSCGMYSLMASLIPSTWSRAI